MDTQKRRIVYFSDPEWEQLRTKAKEAGQSISAYLREKGWAEVPKEHAVATTQEPGQSARFMTQAERDEVLGRVNKRRH